MDLVCVQCGQTIVVEGLLVDGQNILCPFCGEKSQYSEPSRIELPMPESKRKPELYVRRPQVSNTVETDMASEAVKAVENRARIVEELKDREARRRRWGNLVDIIILIIVLVGGFVGYDIWRTRREKAAAAEDAARLAEIQAEAEKNKEIERQRVEAQALRERERAALEAERQAKEKEESRKREEIRTNKEKFAFLVSALQNDDIAFVSDLKKVDGQPSEIAYLFPHLDNQRRSFVILETNENGEERLTRLTGNGEREETDKNQFQEALKDQDYLAIADKKIYFHSRRKKQHVGRLSKQKNTNLTDAFFGAMSEEVKSLDSDFSNLSFEIVFVPDPNKPRVFNVLEVVNFGSDYSISRFRNEIEELYPPKELKVRTKAANKFKRKVVFWDGSHIKTGVDGVIYVPRTRPSTRQVSVSWNGYGRVYSTGHSTAADMRWENLCDRAREEECEEQAYYARQAEDLQRGIASLQKSAAEEYKAKIDRIINDGELFFRAKIK